MAWLDEWYVAEISGSACAKSPEGESVRTRVLVAPLCHLRRFADRRVARHSILPSFVWANDASGCEESISDAK